MRICWCQQVFLMGNPSFLLCRYSCPIVTAKHLFPRLALFIFGLAMQPSPSLLRAPAALYYSDWACRAKKESEYSKEKWNVLYEYIIGLKTKTARQKAKVKRGKIRWLLPNFIVLLLSLLSVSCSIIVLVVLFCCEWHDTGKKKKER